MSSSSSLKEATGRQIGTLLLALVVALFGGGTLLAGMALPFVGGAATLTNAFSQVMDDVPDNLGFTEPSEQSVLLAEDGSVLARFYAENRVNVTSDQISKHMKDAVIATEDRRFYEHHGIDVQGIVRALFSNSIDGGRSGGSSITQQYVKNALLEEGRVAHKELDIRKATEQTMARKINEARYSIAIEKTMSKDDILTGYLNLAQFGPSQYGVEIASQRYFSKSAKDLTVVEAATIAGITQNPSKWDPVRHPENNIKRRNFVLSRMLENGYITKKEHDDAVNTPLEAYMRVSEQSPGCGSAGISAYFCEYVVKDLLQDESWGKNREDRTAQLYRGGLIIHTTINTARQQQAYDAVVKNQPVDDPSQIQASLVSIEPSTGNVQAMVQNTRYGIPNETDKAMTQVNLNVSKKMGGGSGYQAGSSFKIFTLFEWLDSGFSAGELVQAAGGYMPKGSFRASCVPRTWNDWNVGNLGWGGGLRSVADLTKNSINGGYARMAQRLDLCNIVDKAKKMGVERGDGEDWSITPSLVLGSNNVTPISMASAVATLANDGKHCTINSYTKIEKNGKVIAKREPKCEQVVSQETARKTTQILRLVPTPGATGEKASLGGRPVAGKTGTANRDWHAWFVGYTPQLATAVWQGHMSGNISMLGSVIKGRYYSQVYGGLFPATIFSDFMIPTLRGQPPQAFPAPATSAYGGYRQQLQPRSHTPSSNSDGDSNTDSAPEAAQGEARD